MGAYVGFVAVGVLLEVRRLSAWCDALALTAVMLISKEFPSCTLKGCVVPPSLLSRALCYC